MSNIAYETLTNHNETSELYGIDENQICTLASRRGEASPICGPEFVEAVSGAEERRDNASFLTINNEYLRNASLELGMLNHEWSKHTCLGKVSTPRYPSYELTFDF